MVAAVDSGIYKRLRVAGFEIVNRHKGEQVKQEVTCLEHQETFKVIPVNLERNKNGAGLCYGCTNEQVKAKGVMATFTSTVGTNRSIKPWDYPKRLTSEFQARFDERHFKHTVTRVSAVGCTYRCDTYHEKHLLPLNWFRGWAKPNCSCAADGKAREGLSSLTVKRNGVRYIKCSQHGEQKCSAGAPRCLVCDQEAAQLEKKKLEKNRQPLIRLANELGYTLTGLRVTVCEAHSTVADLSSPTFRHAQLVCRECLEKKLQAAIAAELWKIHGKIAYKVSPTHDVLATVLFSSNKDWSVQARFDSINIAASKQPQVRFINAQDADKRYTGQAFQLGLGVALFGKLEARLHERNPEITLLSAGLRTSAPITVRHTCGFVWTTRLANIIAGQPNCPTCARKACGKQNQVVAHEAVEQRVRKSAAWKVDHWEPGQNKSRSQQLVCACKTCGTLRSFPDGFTLKAVCQKCHPLRSHASKAELDWLASIEAALSIKLASAASGKQHSLILAGKRHRLDGYSSKHNTAFEFLGDYWHGKDDPSRYMKSIQRLARLSQVMDVVYVWESDFTQGKLLSGKLTGRGECPL